MCWSKLLTRKTFSLFDLSGLGFDSGVTWYDEAGNIIPDPFGNSVSGIAVNNPVSILGTVIIVIGVMLILAGRSAGDLP